MYMGPSGIYMDWKIGEQHLILKGSHAMWISHSAHVDRWWMGTGPKLIVFFVLLGPIPCIYIRVGPTCRYWLGRTHGWAQLRKVHSSFWDILVDLFWFLHDVVQWVKNVWLTSVFSLVHWLLLKALIPLQHLLYYKSVSLWNLPKHAKNPRMVHVALRPQSIYYLSSARKYTVHPKKVPHSNIW